MMNPYGWFKEAYDDSLGRAHERIRELEARLRELAEATEWRDECLEAVASCLRRREDTWRMISVSIDPGPYRERWEKATGHARKLSLAAESAYQAALAAAKEKP